ncbi:unnamed protein product [Penicillium olsonii]|nr:unnamed protein product [Penicillium olsonii]CAG7917273.1 unnamed protein product [Penicillium olsonii]
MNESKITCSVISSKSRLHSPASTCVLAVGAFISSEDQIHSTWSDRVKKPYG